MLFNGEEHKPFPFPDYRKKYERDRFFKQEHIRAEIFPDFIKKEFSANEDIYLEAIYGDINEIDIDAVGIKIEEIKFNDGIQKYSYDGEKLNIKLSRQIKKGEKFKITIKYKSSPTRGLYFIAPDEFYPNKPFQIWTQGEDEDTRFWLPSYDFPNERTTTELIVTVPKNYYVISNGKLISKKESNSNITFHYLEDFPHPIYLTSIAAGEFFVYEDEIDGLKIEYAVPKYLKNDFQRTFINTPDMIKHFSRLLNFKYPYNKYSQVVVNDFVVGGMENINATTLTEYTIHDDRAHNDYMSEGLVAHELSHQWFGDYVTCRDWSHAWLNEGFATYMTAVYLDHFLGYDDFLYQLYQDEISYKKEDSQNYRRPIVTNVYKYPSELFDRHLYEKASRVIHMLRDEMGDEQFWSFINTYLKENGGKSIDTYDFIKTLQKVTGKSWEQFFDQWIFHAGHPEFNVTYSFDKGLVKLKFEQVQKGQDTLETFNVKMDIAFYVNGTRMIKTIRICDRIEQFTFEMDEPEAISIDPDNVILKDIKFERKKNMLIRQLELGKGIMEKIDAISQLKKLPDKEVIEKLKNVVIENNYYGVKIEALNALEEIGTEDALNAMDELGKHIIGNRDVDSRVRTAYADCLGKFYKSDKALNILKEILSKDKKYLPISKALESIGQIKHEKSFEILKEWENVNSWSEIIRRGMIIGFANLNDKRAFDIIEKYTSLGFDQRLRSVAIFAVGKIGENDKNVLPILYKALRDKYLPVRSSAVLALRNVNLPESIEELDLAYEIETEARIKRSIRETIESILKGKKESEELKNLREQLEELRRKVNNLSEKLNDRENN